MHFFPEPGNSMPTTPFNPATSTSVTFVRKYLTGILLVICLIIVSIFWGFNYKASILIRQQLLQQGRAFFQEVVLTREWIANHGGVYVKLEPGVEVNQYLQQVPGLKVVIRDEQGVAYTLKNPALVTREISEIAAQKGLFTFRITSANPLNPNNAPDRFEQSALQQFATGTKEHADFEQRGDAIFYRYMAPLIVQKNCLRCHGMQGYKEGDVRGGISVTMSATGMMEEIGRNRLYLTISAIGIVVLICAIIFFIASSFIKDLRVAEHRLMEMATKDYLTGLLSRRETFRLVAVELSRAVRFSRPLSVALLDLDHFKQINDTHGHAVGDTVLQEIARMLRTELREYDIICRYGGEEFLVVMPDTTLVNATIVGERLRKATAGLAIHLGERETLQVTVSCGIAQMRDNEDMDQLISRADTALYGAKSAGRNQVNPAV